MHREGLVRLYIQECVLIQVVRKNLVNCEPTAVQPEQPRSASSPVDPPAQQPGRSSGVGSLWHGGATAPSEVCGQAIPLLGSTPQADRRLRVSTSAPRSCEHSPHLSDPLSLWRLRLRMPSANTATHRQNHVPSQQGHRPGEHEEGRRPWPGQGGSCGEVCGFGQTAGNID